MPEAKRPRPVNHFRLTIAGKEPGGLFRECSGLDTVSDIAEPGAVDATGSTSVAVAGTATWASIELKRGIDRGAGLAAWRDTVLTQGPDKARADCTLELCDHDGSVIATYSILQAWPSRYTYAAMNAGATEIPVEAVTLAHEGVRRS